MLKPTLKKSKTIVTSDPCAQADGWYVDVSSGCKQYYKCQTMGTKRIFYFNCESGKVFDERVEACIDAEIAIC